LSQSIIIELFDKWGVEGFAKHVKQVQDFYKDRRDKFAELSEKHLKGLAEWSVPTAGMFFWYKGNLYSESLILVDALL
jgi:DNA-binding transcriptional MocR family regulator